MKWKKKYNVDLEEAHRKNIEGASLSELSEEYGVPKSTLNRYLKDAGYKIQMNRKNWCKPCFISKAIRDVDYDFGHKNTIPWKQTLIFYLGHRCFICGYNKIVEAHHIVLINEAGPTSVRNGILLCPNCHAEVHAELLDLTEALIKLDELLEHSIKNNQQPSRVVKQTTMYKDLSRDTEGSETNSRAEAVMETRASRSSNMSKRYGRKELKKKLPLLRDMI